MTDYEIRRDEYRSYAENLISTYLDGLTDIPEPMYSAMKYAVTGGGKRIRPSFALHGAEIACGDRKVADFYAIAIELVHCYSLVHDDMPCMDNDTLRRGKPTTHVRYGEGMALLTGDALLSLAFDTVIKCADIAPTPEAFKRALRIFSECIGCNGMVAGQCVDITANKDYPVSYLHSKKTSALLRCALVGGAAVAGGGDELLLALDEYAENVGLAFQITDDILDVIGDEKILGKSIGKDGDQNKRTYPAEYGIEESRRLAKFHVDCAIKAISNVKGKEFLSEFAQNILNRDR